MLDHALLNAFILKKAVISPNRREFTNKKFRMDLAYAFKRAQYPTNLEIHDEGGSHMTHKCANQYSRAGLELIQEGLKSLHAN